MRGFSRVNLARVFPSKTARDHTAYDAKVRIVFIQSKSCLEIWFLLFPLQTKVISFGKVLKQLVNFMRNTSNFSKYNCVFLRGKKELLPRMSALNGVNCITHPHA